MLDKITQPINFILDALSAVIETPMKAAITTITGLVTGYIPMTVNRISDVSPNGVDTAFQHTVWTLTSIVALTAIVSWIQKQRDRWLTNHPKKPKDLFNIAEEDED